MFLKYLTITQNVAANGFIYNHFETLFTKEAIKGIFYTGGKTPTARYTRRFVNRFYFFLFY